MVQTQLTQPGQSSQELMNTLNSIRNTPSPAVAQNNIMSAMTQLTAGQTPNIANYGNQMYQQNVQPLMGQYGNLSQLFDMYLHDQNLAQNYSNQFQPMSTPSGSTQITPDMTSQQAVSAGQGIGTAPGLTTAAMSIPSYATSNMLNALTGAVYNQQGLVNQNMQLASSNYGNLTSALGQLFNYYGQKQTRQDNAINIPGTPQNAAALYQQLKDTFVGNQQASGQPATWDGFYYYLNTQKNALAGQGVDVAELYRLQGLDQKDFGGNSSMTTGQKISAGAAKQAQAVNNGIAAVKNFGAIMQNYLSGYQDASVLGQDVNLPFIGQVMIPKNTNAQKKYGAQKDLYLSNVAKLLGVSRSNQAFQRLAGNLPGNGIGIGADGGFRGHLSTLLDTAQLVLAKDNKTGKYGVTPMTAFDSNTETQVDPNDNNIPLNTLIGIIQGL